MGTIELLAIIFVIILLSMTLHEAMHAFMSYALGDDTAKAQGRLTLNPLKHIDPFMTILLPLVMAVAGGPIFGGAKPVPFNPQRVRYGEWGVALVALAGPLTNLLIAFIAFGVGVIVTSSFTQSSMVSEVLFLVVRVNLGFFAFNMLPIPPLDGSRVLYALAPESVRRGMEWIEQYGVMLVFALVLIGSNLIGQIMQTIISAIVAAFRVVFGV
ncbi:MAG: site-2 protease family protein [Candidatus Saccharibacteria bacterium]|nr:site-2 protease family protein [Candidatus Saccharibacteria bacterium]